MGKNKAQPSFFLQTDFEDVWELACVVGAWMYWVKERTGAREGAHIFSCAHYFQAPATQAIWESDEVMLSLSGANILEGATFTYTCRGFFTRTVYF